MCMTHNGGAGPMSGPSMRDSYSSASESHYAGDGHNHGSNYSPRSQSESYRTAA